MVVLKKRPTIFICEPEDRPANPLVEYLAIKGFYIHCITESSQAIDQIITRVPEIVLLDADLPSAGGYEVCSAVRVYYSGPILFQGQAHDEAAQLLAFERGADDYIFTPVSPTLMAARICAHLRRSHGLNDKMDARRIRAGKLVLDAARREVFLAGAPVDLTTVQFNLLWYLAKRSGRVVPRQELYEALFQQKYNGFDRSVDVYISRIRNQLGDDPESPSYLKNRSGSGLSVCRLRCLRLAMSGTYLWPCPSIYPQAVLKSYRKVTQLQNQDSLNPAGGNTVTATTFTNATVSGAYYMDGTAYLLTADLGIAPGNVVQVCD